MTSPALFQAKIGNRLSLNGMPASSPLPLSRSSSLRSTNSDGNGKKGAVTSNDGAVKDTAERTEKTVQSATALSGPITTVEHPASAHASKVFNNGLPRAATEQSQPPDQSTLNVSSSGVSSSASTLPVDEMDEDLDSTRSISPFEDLGKPQPTSEATNQPEDLPEGLRLMRVAQRHGIKVIDFAFDGPKREGVVEAWAWEGGAACKGFGIGFGGGAYSGPLKKYKPPQKEPSPEQQEDKMLIDTPPPPPLPSIFSARPGRPGPISLNDNTYRIIDRPLNSPPAQPRGGMQPTLSQSGFLQYLQERANLGCKDPSGIKREHPFGSSEAQENEFNPLKKRFMG